jgi:DNA-binding MarR family transcriptional regulator
MHETSRGGDLMAKADLKNADQALREGDRWIDGFVPYQLYRATTKLNAKLMAKLKATDINGSQWRVLSVLKAYGTLSLSKIVELTLMEQPTVSRVVAQLERDGRIVRQPSPTDSRVLEITLTQAGVKDFNEIIPTALRHQELAFKGFSRKEIEAFSAMLTRIEENLEYYG